MVTFVSRVSVASGVRGEVPLFFTGDDGYDWGSGFAEEHPKATVSAKIPSIVAAWRRNDGGRIENMGGALVAAGR
jgi:hypothetical protein